ncbi:MAG: ribosome-associated translation inhibitor RaiA [Chloroflexota bacterium]|nr:ribosome-associated translation inhibitor RaiA [Chloroflexota bacterium]
MTIKIEIFTKNLELNDRLNDYVVKKVEKFEKFLEEVDECRVDLSHIKTARNASDRHVAQLTLRGKGFILRAEERSDSMFSAVDAAIDKMRRQIRRYKGKRDRGRGDGQTISQAIDEAYKEEISVEEEQPIIAKRKRFMLSPMDELEAVEQMKLLGHENFFIFYNANTSEFNVLYRRRDGTYGIIIPAIG